MNLTEYSPTTALLHGRDPRPRHPLLTAALALLCPGLGHLYLSRRARALLLMIGTVVAVLAIEPIFVLLGARSFVVYYCLVALVAGAWLGQAFHAIVLARRSGAYRLTKDNHVPTYVLFAAHFWLLTVLGAYVERAFVADRFIQPAVAMAPTIVPGDELYIAKLDVGRLRYGDVVLYEHHFDAASTAHILELGRVFGLPGDLVERADGTWFRNDKPVEMREIGPVEVVSRGVAGLWQTEEMLAFEQTEGETRFAILRALDWEEKADRDEFILYEVPRGHVYLLADNRDGHWDSRDYGAIRMTEIVGRPTMVWGEVRPERFALDRVGQPID